jgi:hypothetical protein
MVGAVRSRLLVVVLALAVATACFAGFATSSSARAQDAPPPTTTTPGVEVGGKQVERSPEKDPVDADEMARTGTSRVAWLASAGLIALGVGLVLVDLARSPADAVRPLPRRVPPPPARPARGRGRRYR